MTEPELERLSRKVELRMEKWFSPSMVMTPPTLAAELLSKRESEMWSDACAETLKTPPALAWLALKVDLSTEKAEWPETKATLLELFPSPWKRLSVMWIEPELASMKGAGPL